MPQAAGSAPDRDRLAPVRTVFLGTSAFAAEVLELLAATPHRPLLVVTRPDRPRGRGRRLAPPPVAEAGRALGIEVFQPAEVNDDAARVRAKPLGLTDQSDEAKAFALATQRYLETR